MVVPYAAVVILVGGLTWRVVRWSLSPVPFRIPTVCGQQKSLPWIKSSWLESPHTTGVAVARMALEILLFRSLFRNTRVELDKGPRLLYGENKFLWLGALAFHWSLLIIADPASAALSSSRCRRLPSRSNRWTGSSMWALPFC